MHALQGPAIQMVRRHSRSTDAFHFGPALQTVSGNWVAGKRRGVIDGIDFGLTGTVSGAPDLNCRTCSKPVPGVLGAFSSSAATQAVLFGESAHDRVAKTTPL